MNAEPTDRIAAMLAALAQPTRLKIIEVVGAGGADGTPAGQIAQAVRCPASTLSFHLKELSLAGLLEAHPQGRFIRYTVRPQAFGALAAFVARLPGSPPAIPPPQSAAVTRKGTKTGKRARAKDDAASATTEGQISMFGD
jgi:DNA-binding transcriptional ArsR family regulator